MKKKWLKYIIFILFMICFIFAGNISLGEINNHMSRSYKPPMFWFWTTDIVLYIGFGFLMALDYLIKERAKDGKWRINVSKLMIIGVPSLVFAYMFYWFFLLYIPAGGFINLLISGKSIYMPLFKILLGYTIATSFYKESDAEGI